MLYESELASNAVDATKNICSAKSEGTVYPNTVTRWINKFSWSYQNLYVQVSLGGPKIEDSKGLLQAREANLVSRTQRV